MTAECLCFSSNPFIFVVTEVKKIEAEKKGSLAGRLFRLLKASGVQESEIYEANVRFPECHEGNQLDVRKAWLEAEYRKAEALLEQRRRRLGLFV